MKRIEVRRKVRSILTQILLDNLAVCEELASV